MSKYVTPSELGTAASLPASNFATAAQGVTGQSAMTQIVSHRNRTDNPHVVTLAQIGAASSAQGAKADTSVQPADLSTAIANLVNAAPGTLDTLGELAAALQADESAAAALLATVGTKASASDLADHEADSNNPHSVTATQVGLGSADDTSDLDKPVSTAQQSALDAKMDADTALSMLADLQGKYDDLNQQFLLLLRFVITTFGQVPEGLESQFEAALGA